MAKTNITAEEKEALQAYAKTSTLVLVRLKSQAVLFASNDVRTEVIADSLGKTTRTVSDWLSAWRQRRMSSVFTGHRHNDNAAKLTREQKAQIKQTLQQPPSDQGLPRQFWDVPQLKTYIEAGFGIVYECDQSYHFLLKFSNLSFKYPDTFDLKRNEELIEQRIEAIRAEIKPLFHRDDWEVFAADEVKMQQDAVIRRAWLKKGQKTVIKVDRDKQSQSYIGFLNQKTFDCHLHEIQGRQNSANVLEATQQFLKRYPNKHIAIIWDNASFHKSKQIKDQLKKGGIMEKVHLIAMPPYAPDENTIEHVWNTAKQKVANIQQQTFEDTKQAFADYVSSRQFRYAF